ncbi:integral peroxisomal membrane peroxin-domain-containing protein [Irpex rosettiformis]|uniref:Integral peroxisomal membrane peroxin-domain-containing protein n=1 Tax=Irpex rosettiformis TaxID=378272 RepID=A0ACB8UGA4_9APHY|nr:integral peroxisomal membrane peroxin-domain-containing protein [Irpex rosettiformis]
MSKPVQDVSRPPLTQVLNTLPSPLTISLVGLGPVLSRVRRLLEILSWKSSWEESWLALSCWWVVCLCSDIALRYGLPLLLCGLVVASRRINPVDSSLPTDEDTLHQAIMDLTIIPQLLPSLPRNLVSTDNLTILIVVRTIAIIYVPYLFLTYFVRLRVLVAIAGTILITWRARWALLIRRAFWRSAYIRWGTYHLWSRITGLPLPPPITPADQTVSITTTEKSNTSASPANSIRFLFTVYENQRWWMGLDFTAALLPGERPSWCTNSQQPVSPPAVFALPASTTIYLPDPSRKNGKIKRMARWTWEEPEWKVVMRKEGSPATRVERPLPSMQDESTATASATRILKAAGKMRQASISGDISPERQRKENGDGDGELKKDGERGDDAVPAEPYTDADGWVYCDNKWENGSAKGGIGKYTRYRRWTRVAVLNESVEFVDASSVDLATRIEQSPTTLTRTLPPALSGASSSSSDQHVPLSPTVSAVSVGTQGSSPSTPQSPTVDDDRSRLRQRLKAAVRGGSIG